MSIINRQITKVIADVTRQVFIDGKQPTLSDITQGIITRLKNLTGTPTIKIRPQQRKSKFNIDNYNKIMKEISFDLQIAYDELVDIVAQSLRRLNMIDVSYHGQSQQLEEIIGTLDNALFTISNADDNFFGVFDNFESLSKVDTTKTTRHMVDLNERVVLLPANNLTGTKLNMSFLYNSSTWPVKVKTNSKIITNTVGSNAEFGNAFSNIHQPWRQDIWTDSATNPVTIEFDIPISSVKRQEISINRIQIIPHSETPMKIAVLYSTDGVNYLTLQTTKSEAISKREAQHVNFDFSTTRVESIRFQVTKDLPDEQSGNRFRYSFGFKHIGFYTFGRQLAAELVSKPLVPVGMSRAIDKVILQANEIVPDGTNIRYFVGLADENNELIGDWRSISPIDRTFDTIEPKIVKFGDTSKRSISITAASNTLVDTKRSISFYALPIGVSSGDSYIPRSAQLYRGFNAWNKNTRNEKTVKQIKDSYISFNAGDIQKLYAVLTEQATPGEGYQTFPGGGTSTTLQTTLKVSNLINYNAATMSMIPAAGIDINIDQRPNYAVYRVSRFRAIMQIQQEQIILAGTVPTLLAQAHPLVGLSDRPIVQDNAATPTVTFTEGIDYHVHQDVNGRPTGEISRIDGGSIGDGDTVKVTYTLNSDITHLVDGIRDDTIYLSTILNIDEDDRFDVTYRFVPIPTDNTIIKASARVTEKFGDSIEGKVYQEGPDYAIDVNRGTITRIPSGKIGPDSGGDISVYVDFYYENISSTLNTYTTWVFQYSKSPITINYSKLNLDKASGERLIWTTPTGQTVDLTDATQFPELSFGWHNILVKSKDPLLFANAAINLVIKMKDINNKYILAKGNYFNLIQANRTPMKEVSLDYLKYSTIPTNHNHFAINNDNKVIINFQPGSTDDLYLMQARYDPSNPSADPDGYVISTYPEEFLLEYRFETVKSASNKLLVRVLMDKTFDTDGGVTPKLYNYNVRVG